MTEPRTSVPAEAAPAPYTVEPARAAPRSRAARLLRRRGVRRTFGVAVRLVPLAGIAVAVRTWSRLPHWHLTPALLGLVCWTLGNYLVCPLRWRAVSARPDRGRVRWYGRVYAEGELLGMLTPQHAGADVWRVRQLVATGAERSVAVMEVAADRLAGGAVVFVLALLAGMRIPPGYLPVAGGVVALVAALAWATRRRWLPRLRALPRPDRRRFARAAAISSLYQAGYLGFVLGLVAAVGAHVDVLGAATLLGVSQAASLLPGVHGAGPKEGAMATGLMTLGVPLASAFAVVALGAALTWVPAVVVGGSGLGVRACRRRLGGALRAG